MTTLADTQRAFQRHVMHGDADILGAVIETENVPAAARLGIYSEAYRLRLRDALSSNFPRLEELVGADEFSTMAMRYIDEQPSQFTSIRWFGHRLPELLEHSHAVQPWLAELARWEWAIASAFDAADRASLALEALATVAPDDWPGLCFEFHPSVQRLQMRTNAPALFKALSDELTPPVPAVSDAEQAWLVWRQELGPHYRSLAPSEAGALDAMRGGASFAAMCDTLCQWHAEEEVALQAAMYLKQWLQDGCVVGFR